jgi:hypothetical protein
MPINPATGKQTAVKKKPAMPTAVWSPAVIPAISGYIKLPAPKSIENIARPVVTVYELKSFFIQILKSSESQYAACVLNLIIVL